MNQTGMVRLYYNFATESFTQRNSVANYWTALNQTFLHLGGNVRTPSIARWKARGRPYIHHNLTSVLSLTVETL